MSNNLVSQYPMPERQVVQIEHDPNSLILPVSSMPMEMAAHPESRHINVSTVQGGLVQPLSSDPGFNNSIVGDNKTFPIKRKAEVENPSSNSVSQQSLLSNKRPAPVRSNVNSPGLLQSPPPQRKAILLQTKFGSSTQPLINKKMVRNDPMSNKSGVQKGPTGKKPTARTESTPRVRPDSSEGVRSKMRENLAVALALAYRNQENVLNTDKNENYANMAPQPMNSLASKISNSTGEEGQVLVSEEVVPSNGLTALNKSNDCQVFSPELPAGNGGQAFQGFQYSLPDDEVPFGDNFFGKDDLLQGNGLSWAFEFDVHMGEEKDAQRVEKPKSVKETQGHKGESANLTPDNLGSQIEAELFKMFGHVNKKYREKGRSLIFNLKDRNNPELRERVMSGEISPERLCSMSGEELASKELSEWRVAKAEELAQMKVLPDTEVDIRRLVRKTHKGEFQVEVEHVDTMTAEVSGGAYMQTVLTNSLPKKETESQSPSNASLKDKEKSDGQDFSGSLIIPTDGTDLMQGIIVDELKDAEFLPPIVSLDEFMESLNNEPPFENLSVDACAKSPVSHIVSPKPVSNIKARASDAQKDTSSKRTRVSQKPDVSMKSYASPSKQMAVPSDVRKPDYIWNGMLQLSISSFVTVGGLFRSGEKTSTKDWPLSLEIKGRVRIDAFSKFLQELPMSRTRAVMILHFVLVDKSIEEQRSNFSEAIDSYTADERPGFAEPLPGVELYLCPPTSKMFDLLSKFMPKDRQESTSSFENGLIGVVVWRRAHISNNISPNSSTHHKNISKRQPSAAPLRAPQDSPNLNSRTPHKPNPEIDVGDDDDDVPPGFGPGVAAKEDDDLPEFNFTPQASTHSPSTVKKTPRPVDEMRELIKKYGQSSNSTVIGSVLDDRSVGVEPWNDDDDDIPEWRPQAPLPPTQLLYPAAHVHTNNQLHATQHPPMRPGYRPPPGAAPGHLQGQRWRPY